jgi:glycosyltransferase involved in cell wall biosynthesis
MNAAAGIDRAASLFALCLPTVSASEHQVLADALSQGLAGGTILSPHELTLPAGWRRLPVRPRFPRFPKSRGLLTPFLPLRAMAGVPASLLLIVDELFGSTLLHAAYAKRVQRAAVIVYCFEDLPFRPLMRLSARFFSRFVDVALCSCREAALRAQEVGVVHTLLCPYPVWEPEPAAVRTVTQVRTVGYIGRLVPEKGIGELLQAVQEVPDLEFRVYGRGPLLEQVQQTPGVRYLGSFAGRSGLEEVYRGLDVLILPSRALPHWREQYGRVLAEAMARGVIPIGSDCGAIPAVVGDPRLIFPAGDAAALAARLRWLQGLSPAVLGELRRSQRVQFSERLATGVFQRRLREAAALCGVGELRAPGRHP